MDGVEIVEGSILDQRALDTTVSGAGAIVHLAARPSVTRSLEDPLASHEVNATGTLRVLEAARHAGGSHVIVASSSSVYGAKPALPASEAAAVAPVSPYAASKAAAEAYSLSYGGSFGLPVTVYRFFNVFGPLQRADHAYAAVVPAFVSAALAGKALPVHGDGSQTRDFTYVGSVVQVLAATVTRRVVAPAPVNLAFGSRSSLLEVVSALEIVIGSAARSGISSVPAGRRPRFTSRSIPFPRPLPRCRACAPGRGVTEHGRVVPRVEFDAHRVSPGDRHVSARMGPGGGSRRRPEDQRPSKPIGSLHGSASKSGGDRETSSAGSTNGGRLLTSPNGWCPGSPSVANTTTPVGRSWDPTCHG